MASMASLRNRLWDRLRLNLFLYPGIIDYHAADFLRPYYDWQKQRQGPLRVLFNAIVWAGFCLWLPFRCRKVARHWGKDSAWKKRILPMARRTMTDPEDFATFDITSEKGLRHYQRRMEQVPIIRTIESASTDHSPDLIDKSRFQARCEAHGLAVPHLYAVIRQGSVELLRPLDGTTDSSLLLKPVQGSGGRGIETLPGSALNAPDMLVSRFAEGEWLVQEQLRPHPALGDIALDALPTLRMTTILNEAGKPELMSAGLRFASRAGVAVDNGHAGGLVAPVDLANGLLGTGIDGWGPGSYPTHPATGAAIAGRAIPDWQQAIDLVLGAHAQAYGEHVIIGWDVGLSSRGPVLIEGNQRPAVRLTQRCAGKGIGQMRYGDLLQFHLQRAIGQEARRPIRRLERG